MTAGDSADAGNGSCVHTALMARWLLVVPIAMPLLIPLYNRVEPRWWAMPFFYWYQLACALVAVFVIAVVYLAERGRP